MPKIAVLAGDGIGPEVMKQALRVLSVVADDIETIEATVGGAAFEAEGCHLPSRTLEICSNSDAVLFGSVGGPLSQAGLPKWRDCETRSILALRRGLQLYANLRPIRVYAALAGVSPVRVGEPVDMVIVRELQGDIYFGAHERLVSGGARMARDEAVYDETQIRAIAETAFGIARGRRRKVTSVDKANVLETSKLWREIVDETAIRYSDVEIEHILVDNCAMQLVLRPQSFDVLLAPNMFGDILSDLAAVLPGSIGLTPSASFSRNGPALYEPSGGSAPDLAGKGLANPTAQILCVAMMLRHSFGREHGASTIEAAVSATYDAGFRTADLTNQSDCLGSAEFTDQVLSRLS